MPEYLAPGVYVEETSFRPKTIEGVSTSTAGFVGPARSGPTSGEPRLLTSFADFQRIYGGLEDLKFDGKQPRTNYLAYAVRAFFEEGGQRCYVARVFDAISESDDGVASKTVDDVTFSARYPGSASEMRVIVRGIAAGNANRGGRLTGVSVGDTVLVNPGNGTTLAGKNRGRAFWDYAVDDASGGRALKGGGKTVKESELAPGDEVYPFRVRVLVQRPQKQPGGGVEYDPEEQVGEYTLRPDSSNPLINGLKEDNPSGNPVMTPVAMKEVTDGGDPVTTGTAYAEALFDTSKSDFTEAVEIPVVVDLSDEAEEYEIELSTGSNVKLLDQVRLSGTLTPASASVSVDTSSSPMTVTMSGAVTASGEGTLLYLRAQMTAPGETSISIDGMSITPKGGSQTSFSGYESIAFPSIGPGDVLPFRHPLNDGNDGQEPMSYVTTGAGSGPPDDPEGFDALEDLENVSIVAAPGYTEISNESAKLAVQGQLIDHCADMKYRIAVLDTPKDSTVKEARDWRGNIDSTYAAMYHPWITIFDPLTRSELNVPPSGHVAGIYARNDIENGVHKAPANEVVRSAVGFEKRLNKAQQDVLNPEGVNCFRFFEGRGNRLWGARMATSDNEYKYVNIRRYLAYLERSIDQGTQVFVFENNGTDLWRNVRR
ncbi:MAG: phage tail sheath subtilisin-like domain-containing protein, partial [Salinibacter sp.]